MGRIPGIGLLRFIAAALVLLSHVTYWTGATNIDVVGRLLARGDSGVAIFFAISAFLLTTPGHRPEPLSKYARKRFSRIMPAYLVALAAVVAVSVVLADSAGGPGKALAHVFMLQGYTGDAYRGFSQAWSLTTEATFYLCVPWLRGWLRRCVESGQSPLPLLAVVAGVSVAVQAASASSGVQALGVLSTSLLAHAAWFAVGMALAWSVTRGHSLPRDDVLTAWACSLYALISTPLGGPMDLTTPSWIQAGVKEIAYALIAWLALAAAVSLTVRSEATSRQLMGLGDLSYGVFLWHVLVLQVLFAALGLHLFAAPFGLTLVAVSSISLLLAWLTWHVVEKPGIRWGQR